MLSMSAQHKQAEFGLDLALIQHAGGPSQVRKYKIPNAWNAEIKKSISTVQIKTQKVYYDYQAFGVKCQSSDITNHIDSLIQK